MICGAGNTKGGSITVPLTSCLTGLDYSVLQTKTKILSSFTGDSEGQWYSDTSPFSILWVVSEKIILIWEGSPGASTTKLITNIRKLQP
jgi:hypothetical protein